MHFQYDVSPLFSSVPWKGSARGNQDWRNSDGFPSHFPTLAHFCGKRDLKSLTQTDLMSVFNIPKADALVLFGGSILTGGDLLANPLYAF